MKSLDQKIKLAKLPKTFFPLFYLIPIVSFIPSEHQNFSIFKKNYDDQFSSTGIIWQLGTSLKYSLIRFCFVWFFNRFNQQLIN